MPSYKKILLFIIVLLPMITTTANADSLNLPGTNQCGINISDQVLPDLGLSMITNFAYCSCGVKLENNPSFLEKDKEEGDILDYKNIDMAQCVSDTEKVILQRKQDIFKEENSANEAIASQSGSFRYESKRLTFNERKLLAENTMGLNCGNAGDKDYVSCMKDLRTYHYQLKKDEGLLGGMGTQWSIMSQGWLNYFMAMLDSVFGSFSFGFRVFDTLPNLGYSSSDMFNPKTLVGAINTFVLMLLAFLIIFYFFNKTTERDGEDYKTFFIKIALILVITIGFPSIYNGINSGLQGMNATIVDTLQRYGLESVKVQDISMDRFGNMAVTTITPWIPVALINLIILFLISAVVIARNIFLYVIGYVFFLFAIGLVIGTMRRDNIMEATDVTGKTGKFLTEGLFWGLSLFISVAVSVFLFKITTIIFGTFPSLENGNRNMIDGINSLGIDSFFYFIVLGAIILIWRYYIIDMTFSVVSNVFKKLLFNDDSGGLWTRDFYGKMNNAYEAIKTHYDDQKENNPWAIGVQRRLDSIVDTASGSFDAFVQNNSVLQGLAGMPGADGTMHLFGTATDALSDETSALRRGLRTVVGIGTGMGKGRSVTKEDLKILGFDTGIQGERTKILEETDTKIEDIKSHLTGDDGSDRALLTQIRLLEERKQKVLDDRGNEQDVESIQNLHREISQYEEALQQETDPKKKELLQYKLEESLYKKKHGYENLDQRMTRQNILDMDNEIRKIAILQEHGAESIDEELAIDEEMQLLRSAREELNNELLSGEAKRKKEVSEMNLNRLEYEKALLEERGLETKEKEEQIQETEQEHIKDRVAYLEKEKERLLSEIESHAAIDHDISAIKQYEEERYGTVGTAPETIESPVEKEAIRMELPPKLANIIKPEVTDSATMGYDQQTEQPKIVREDENIIRFIERYGKYKESAISSGERDNISVFGDDPIVGDILSSHFAETGDIYGVGDKIDEAFARISTLGAMPAMESVEGRA